MKYTTRWNETIGAYEVVRSDGVVVQTNIMTAGKAEVARWGWQMREIAHEAHRRT